MKEGLCTKFTATIKIRWPVCLLGVELLCLDLPSVDQETLVLCSDSARIRGHGQGTAERSIVQLSSYFIVVTSSYIIVSSLITLNH